MKKTAALAAALAALLVACGITPLSPSPAVSPSPDVSPSGEGPSPSPPPSPPPLIDTGGPATGNIVNGGFVALYEGRLYYRSNDGNKLYSMNIDGTDRRKLSDDEPWYINADGGRLYYQNRSDDYKLYSIKTDGTDRRKLNDDKSFYVTVADGRVYYQNTGLGRALFSVNTDGTDRRKLNDDDSNDINVVNGRVYYRVGYKDNGKFYSISTDGSDRRLVNGDDTWCPNVTGETVFYRNFDDDGKLYAAKTDGTGKWKLCDDVAPCINVAGDRIYYRNESDGGKLYAIRTDGTDRKKLCDDESYRVFLANDRVYYQNESDGDKLYTIKTDGTDRREADSPLPEPPAVYTAKLQLGGDVLLHGNPIGAAAVEGGYDFSPYFTHMGKYIDGDLVIVNMEAPVDAYGGNARISAYPRFNSPYEILPALRGIGVNFLVNANNHCIDQGFEGLVATRENIIKAGFWHTGTNATREQYDEYTIVDIGGINIGVIAYTYGLNYLESLLKNGEEAFAARKFSSRSYNDVGRIIADMDACRAAGADFIILSLHWGVEYADEPSATQREIARRLCEGGADIILGNHSHCVQPVEWLPGKDGGQALVFYSLGNFFADQYLLNPPIPKTEFAVLVDIELCMEEGGAAEFVSAGYRPTFTLKYKKQDSPNGLGYYMLPAGDYIAAEQMPDVFTRNSEWQMCKDAFAHVRKIFGDVITPLG